MTFALEFRPRTFKDTVGQKSVRVVLMRMVQTEDLPPALLFAGPRGTGKTTTGRIFAAALNCEEKDGHDPCGVCGSCKAVFDGSSPDVIEVDAASNGLVGDIRSIREAVLYSTGGRYRVVLLDEAHSMSREAFNALLKVLEEPPPNTIFLLLTTEPGRIIETVVSRCMLFEFRRLSVQDIRDRLDHIIAAKQLMLEPDLVLEIANRAQGGMRDAVMTLDQVSRVGIQTVDQFRTLLGDSDYAPLILSAMLSQGVGEALNQLELVMYTHGDAGEVSSALIGLLRDLFILQAGGSCPVMGDALQVRIELLQKLSLTQLFKLASVMWDFKTKIRAGEDQWAALELAIVLMCDSLTSQEVVTVPSVHSQPLTLSALQNLAQG